MQLEARAYRHTASTHLGASDGTSTTSHHQHRADSLERLARCLGLMQKAIGGGTVSTHKLAAFLYISTHDGCWVAELAEAVGVSGTHGSRLVAELGLRGRDRSTDRKLQPRARDVPGAGLVQSFVDQEDTKLRRVRLTPKGHNLSEKLRRLLD
jgi:DNA-binding MarR family transcriptional regulator